MTMHIIIIQKDNNDSEAMERHHHDMELHGTTVCLFVETEDRDPQKKTHGSG